MSGQHCFIRLAILEKKALALERQSTVLRRCLRCESWMHSTGPDHRLCNPCKGEPDYRGSPVGMRMNMPGRRKGRTA